jgi:peptidoglycan-associated lipoprotein
VKVSHIGFGAISLAIICSACGGEPEPPETPPPPPPPSAAPPPPTPVMPEKDDGQSGTLNISPDILEACGISAAEALFAFDSAKLRGGDLPVLDKLSACFTTGKLAGKTMRLVGHADPRGDEEYNLVLGGRRADSVKQYLVGAGLPQGQAQTTSRGEMDATGTEPAGWQRDRRVDVVLAN